MKKNKVRNIYTNIQEANIKKIKKICNEYLKQSKKVAVSFSAENGRCKEQNY